MSGGRGAGPLRVKKGSGGRTYPNARISCPSLLSATTHLKRPDLRAIFGDWALPNEHPPLERSRYNHRISNESGSK